MPIINGTLTSLAFFKNAAILVEFFFILSGFVLAHTYTKRTVDFKKFVAGRFFRLFPLHLFMLGIFVFLYSIRGFILPGTEVFHGANSLNELLPNALLIHAWFNYFTDTSFNYPSWSISIEFGLYIIFYLSLYIPVKKVKLILWGVIGMYFYMELISVSSSPYRGLSCFFIGVFVYETIYKNLVLTVEMSRITATVAEVSLLIAMVFAISSDFDFYRNFNIAIFVCVVILFSLELGLISILLNKAVFQKLGGYSFSVYLTHAALLLVFNWALPILGNILNIQTHLDSGQVDFANVLVNNLYVLLQIFLVVYISSLTYKFVEVSGIKLGQKILNR